MAFLREQFSSHAYPELLKGLREIAQSEGREFQEVLEEAMKDYIESKTNKQVRPEVMAHAWASIEKHRLLYELLSSDG